jgi:filamentous hemagglutinin family protein
MQGFYRQSYLVLMLLGNFTLLSLLTPGLSWGAQSRSRIAADRTLRNPSKVRPNRETVVITGGTRSGDNLFHSFREFSVGRGGVASFQEIAPDVTNIFSRVTGSAASDIRGVIEARQLDGSISPANFFLINPNGIQFGPNASLNIGGSFLATTAERINFADNAQFSAVNPQDAPLLRVNVPVGLQFGQSPGEIRSQAGANLALETPDDPITGGLQVPPGRTLALVGGRVNLPGTFIRAVGGRIELGSVASHGSVSLTPLRDGLMINGWALGYESVQNFEDIALSAAYVVANGSGGGSIQMQGRQVTLDLESNILSNTLGDVNGEGIQIRASQLNLRNRSNIFSDTSGDGNGGEIQIRASQLNLRNNSQISSLTQGSGRAANITITVDRLVAYPGRVSSLTEATGRTGNISVNASNSIELSGGFVEREDGIPAEWYPSGFLTQVTEENATGNGGNLTVSTNRLRISEGAQISTTTFGRGDAGNLNVRASFVEIDGRALNQDGSPLVIGGLPFASGIFSGAEEGTTGNGGNLTLTTDRLRLRNGATLQTATFGQGDAGNLTVQASDRIDLVSAADEALFPTSLLSVSGGIPGVLAEGVREATGRGGTTSIQTGELHLQGGATIAVGSLNPDENQAEGAGSLEIEAQTIRLEDRSRIISETASGDGGLISLQAQNLLLLRRNSQISTSAGTKRRGGDGGNITIDTNLVLAAPLENSDITANAFTGSGGRVRVRANTTGIEAREQPTNFSDITAFSAQGVSGVVTIDSPDVDINQEAVELPAAPVQTELAQGCQLEAEQATASFVNTGRSGLALSPYEPLSDSDILADLRLPNQPASNLSATTESLPVEAKGWIRNDHGDVTLVAEATAITQARCYLR